MPNEPWKNNDYAPPTKKILVNDVEITISEQKDRDDYIRLTDMAHFRDKERTNYNIQNWMRLRSTIEFLGLWEHINNPDFKGVEFDAENKYHRTACKICNP